MTSVDSSAGRQVTPAAPANPSMYSRGRTWGIALLCFLTVTLDGYDTTAIGFVAPTLAQVWQLPGAAFTPAFMATSAGANTATLDRQAQTLHLNVVWTPLTGLDVSLELLRARREVGNGLQGGLTRYLVGAKYAW